MSLPVIPVLRRELTYRPEMYHLPINTVVGKSYGEICWLYWKGMNGIESKMFDSEASMEAFVVTRGFGSALCEGI